MLDEIIPTNQDKSNLDKNLKKKNYWKKEEDEFLKEIILKFENPNWGQISKVFNDKYGQEIKRSPNNCKERHKILQSGERMSKENFSNEEKQLLLDKHEIYGNQWSRIKEFFSFRSEIYLKTTYYKLLNELLTERIKTLKERDFFTKKNYEEKIYNLCYLRKLVNIFKISYKSITLEKLMDLMKKDRALKNIDLNKIDQIKIEEARSSQQEDGLSLKSLNKEISKPIKPEEEETDKNLIQKAKDNLIIEKNFINNDTNNEKKNNINITKDSLNFYGYNSKENFLNEINNNPANKFNFHGLMSPNKLYENEISKISVNLAIEQEKGNLLSKNKKDNFDEEFILNYCKEKGINMNFFNLKNQDSFHNNQVINQIKQNQNSNCGYLNNQIKDNNKINSNEILLNRVPENKNQINNINFEYEIMSSNILNKANELHRFSQNIGHIILKINQKDFQYLSDQDVEELKINFDQEKFNHIISTLEEKIKENQTNINKLKDENNIFRNEYLKMLIDSKKNSL